MDYVLYSKQLSKCIEKISIDGFHKIIVGYSFNNLYVYDFSFNLLAEYSFESKIVQIEIFVDILSQRKNKEKFQSKNQEEGTNHIKKVKITGKKHEDIFEKEEDENCAKKMKITGMNHDDIFEKEEGTNHIKKMKITGKNHEDIFEKEEDENVEKDFSNEEVKLNDKNLGEKQISNSHVYHDGDIGFGIYLIVMIEKCKFVILHFKEGNLVVKGLKYYEKNEYFFENTNKMLIDDVNIGDIYYKKELFFIKVEYNHTVNNDYEGKTNINRKNIAFYKNSSNDNLLDNIKNISKYSTGTHILGDTQSLNDENIKTHHIGITPNIEKHDIDNTQGSNIGNIHSLNIEKHDIDNTRGLDIEKHDIDNTQGSNIGNTQGSNIEKHDIDNTQGLNIKKHDIDNIQSLNMDGGHSIDGVNTTNVYDNNNDTLNMNILSENDTSKHFNFDQSKNSFLNKTSSRFFIKVSEYTLATFTMNSKETLFFSFQNDLNIKDIISFVSLSENDNKILFLCADYSVHLFTFYDDTFYKILSFKVDQNIFDVKSLQSGICFLKKVKLPFENNHQCETSLDDVNIKEDFKKCFYCEKKSKYEYSIIISHTSNLKMSNEISLGFIDELNDIQTSFDDIYLFCNNGIFRISTFFILNRYKTSKIQLLSSISTDFGRVSNEYIYLGSNFDDHCLFKVNVLKNSESELAEGEVNIYINKESCLNENIIYTLQDISIQNEKISNDTGNSNILPGENDINEDLTNINNFSDTGQIKTHLNENINSTIHTDEADSGVYNPEKSNENMKEVDHLEKEENIYDLKMNNENQFYMHEGNVNLEMKESKTILAEDVKLREIRNVNQFTENKGIYDLEKKEGNKFYRGEGNFNVENKDYNIKLADKVHDFENKYGSTDIYNQVNNIDKKKEAEDIYYGESKKRSVGNFHLLVNNENVNESEDIYNFERKEDYQKEKKNNKILLINDDNTSRDHINAKNDDDSSDLFGYIYGNKNEKSKETSQSKEKQNVLLCEQVNEKDTFVAEENQETSFNSKDEVDHQNQIFEAKDVLLYEQVNKENTFVAEKDQETLFNTKDVLLCEQVNKENTFVAEKNQETSFNTKDEVDHQNQVLKAKDFDKNINYNEEERKTNMLYNRFSPENANFRKHEQHKCTLISLRVSEKPVESQEIVSLSNDRHDSYFSGNDNTLSHALYSNQENAKINFTPFKLDLIGKIKNYSVKSMVKKSNELIGVGNKKLFVFTDKIKVKQINLKYKTEFNIHKCMKFGNIIFISSHKHTKIGLIHKDEILFPSEDDIQSNIIKNVKKKLEKYDEFNNETYLSNTPTIEESSTGTTIIRKSKSSKLKRIYSRDNKFNSVQEVQELNNQSRETFYSPNEFSNVDLSDSATHKEKNNNQLPQVSNSQDEFLDENILTEEQKINHQLTEATKKESAHNNQNNEIKNNRLIEVSDDESKPSKINDQVHDPYNNQLKTPVVLIYDEPTHFVGILKSCFVQITTNSIGYNSKIFTFKESLKDIKVSETLEIVFILLNNNILIGFNGKTHEIFDTGLTSFSITNNLLIFLKGNKIYVYKQQDISNKLKRRIDKQISDSENKKECYKNNFLSNLQGNEYALDTFYDEMEAIETDKTVLFLRKNNILAVKTIENNLQTLKTDIHKLYTRKSFYKIQGKNNYMFLYPDKILFFKYNQVFVHKLNKKFDFVGKLWVDKNNISKYILDFEKLQVYSAYISKEYKFNKDFERVVYSEFSNTFATVSSTLKRYKNEYIEDDLRSETEVQNNLNIDNMKEFDNFREQENFNGKDGLQVSIPRKMIPRYWPKLKYEINLIDEKYNINDNIIFEENEVVTDVKFLMLNDTQKLESVPENLYSHFLVIIVNKITGRDEQTNGRIIVCEIKDMKYTVENYDADKDNITVPDNLNQDKRKKISKDTSTFDNDSKRKQSVEIQDKEKENLTVPDNLNQDKRKKISKDTSTFDNDSKRKKQSVEIQDESSNVNYQEKNKNFTELNTKNGDLIDDEIKKEQGSEYQQSSFHTETKAFSSFKDSSSQKNIKKMKIIAEIKSRNNILAFDSVRGNLAVCCGTRLMIYKLDRLEGLVAIAFQDLSTISTSISTVKNYMIVSDIIKGITFFYFQSKPVKIIKLSSSQSIYGLLDVCQMKYLVQNKNKPVSNHKYEMDKNQKIKKYELAIIGFDINNHINIYTYSPNNMVSKKGEFLTHRVCANINGKFKGYTENFIYSSHTVFKIEKVKKNTQTLLSNTNFHQLMQKWPVSSLVYNNIYLQNNTSLTSITIKPLINYNAIKELWYINDEDKERFEKCLKIKFERLYNFL